MLTRARAVALAAVLAAMLLAAGQRAALAGGGPGGVNLFGGVSCGQSGTPSCTVSAGSGPGPAGTPATPGTSAAGHPGGGTAASGGGCSGTPNKAFGCVPAGCHITVQTLACPVTFGAPPGAAPPAPPAPAVLAALARQTLVLPGPVIRSSPAQAALQLTRLPTWLWISPAEWAPRSKTASVPVQGECLQPAGYLADFALAGLTPQPGGYELEVVNGDEPDSMVTDKSGRLIAQCLDWQHPGVVDIERSVRDLGHVRGKAVPVSIGHLAAAHEVVRDAGLGRQQS